MYVCCAALTGAAAAAVTPPHGEAHRSLLLRLRGALFASDDHVRLQS
jgi:hypothetical protein